jgi:hypothetical protein
MVSIALVIIVGFSLVSFVLGQGDECHCTASGDPHYRTFDGVNFDYMGKCKYTLAETVEQDNECSFTVDAINNDRGQAAVSYTHVLEIKFMEHVFRMEQGNKLIVDKQEIRSRAVTEGDKVQVLQSGIWLTLVSPKCGLRVEFDGSMTAFVKIKRDSYADKVRGLCGNCNGNAGDDFVMKNGKRAGNAMDFANSFMAHDEGTDRAECRVEVIPPVVPHPCDGDWTRRVRELKYCGAFLLDSNGPFSQCIKQGRVNVDTLYQSCRYDICMNKENLQKVHQTVCEALQTFAAACAEQKFDGIDWRGVTGCEIKCPGKQVYQRKIPACPTSCDCKRKDAVCPKELPAKEGCACPEGLVLFGTDCVQQTKCPANKEVSLSFKRLKSKKIEQTHTIDKAWDQGDLQEGTFGSRGEPLTMKKHKTNTGHHKENKTNKEENIDLTEGSFDGAGGMLGGGKDFMTGFTL